MATATISATDVKNRLGDLWRLADIDPVIVERNGIPSYLVLPVNKFIAVPIEEYNQLTGGKTGLKPGFAEDIFAGVDVDELLAVDLSEEFAEYM